MTKFQLIAIAAAIQIAVSGCANQAETAMPEFKIVGQKRASEPPECREILEEFRRPKEADPVGALRQHENLRGSANALVGRHNRCARFRIREGAQ